MTTIIKVGDCTAKATVHKIEATPGHYLVQLESQYKDSRNPEAWRTTSSITCEAWGLVALSNEIFNALKDAE